EAAIGPLANVVERIPDESHAGPHADVEVELLPHGHDRRIVDVALALQFRPQLRLGGFIRLRRDRSEQAEFVFREQLYRAIRKGVALGAPAIPADISMDVLRVEAYSFQHAHRLGKDLVADAVSRHGDYCMSRHESRCSLDTSDIDCVLCSAGVSPTA